MDEYKMNRLWNFQSKHFSKISMRKLMQGFLVVGMSVTLIGCSSLIEIKVYTSEAAKDGWTTSTSFSSPPVPVFARYTFEGPKVIVIMCSMLQEVNLLAMGPPLIPVIPGILLPITPYVLAQEMEQLFLYVVIISKKDFFQIDFSKSQLFVNGSHEKYWPSKIKAYWQDEWDQRWDSFCLKQLEAHAKTLPNKSIDTEKRQVILFFEPSASAIQNFQVDLGTIHIHDKEIKIPPLNYSINSYYFYQPFWFTRFVWW